MSVTLQNSAKKNDTVSKSKYGSKLVNVDMRFCELLCAKFCHDMAGPIGAINNGIDFIESKNPDMKKVAIKLVAASSKQAISNLTFLRQAYGFISEDAEISFYTMKTLIINFLRETKINFDIVKNIKGEVVDGQVAKLVYNLVIMTVSVMMYSGDLTVTLNDDTISLTSTALIHKVDQNLEELLQGKMPLSNLTTRNIQVAFTQTLISALKYEVDMNYSPPSLFMLTLTAP